jgi:L-fucose isomerase-like protein
MDLTAERARYEAALARQALDFADVDFVVDELLTDNSQVEPLKPRLRDVDGILAIHLSMGIRDVVEELLTCQKPLALFAAPYSGHEWSQFGQLREGANGKFLECFLTSDLTQLAVGVRPFRALHHLREAKILNVTSRTEIAPRVAALTQKFGTTIQTVDRDRMLRAYDAVDEADADQETRRWIRQAQKVVEPSRDEIYKSCRMALAFERLLAEEQATVMTVDCYGSMYQKLPAFPCVGFVRLNNMGLAGICESDLISAMTFMVLQGLSGKPGFISDPTMDESRRAIILAHCLGSLRMDGPQGKAAPYQLRTIMERQEGCVPQVRMRLGQKVTQATFADARQMVYFTGEIIDTPSGERGCRTKITVRVDGDPEKLWQHWAHGLHRVTCYGDLAADLRRFGRYTDTQILNEA